LAKKINTVSFWLKYFQRNPSIFDSINQQRPITAGPGPYDVEKTGLDVTEDLSLTQEIELYNKKEDHNLKVNSSDDYSDFLDSTVDFEQDSKYKSFLIRCRKQLSLKTGAGRVQSQKNQRIN
jgi:hypothetical protein